MRTTSRFPWNRSEVANGQLKSDVHTRHRGSDIAKLASLAARASLSCHKMTADLLELQQ